MQRRLLPDNIIPLLQPLETPEVHCQLPFDTHSVLTPLFCSASRHAVLGTAGCGVYRGNKVGRAPTWVCQERDMRDTRSIFSNASHTPSEAIRMRPPVSGTRTFHRTQDPQSARA